LIISGNSALPLNLIDPNERISISLNNDSRMQHISMNDTSVGDACCPAASHMAAPLEPRDHRELLHDLGDQKAGELMDHGTDGPAVAAPEDRETLWDGASFCLDDVEGEVN
jgi:hypothetical protein